jgi:DNA-binding GntR family transcriptional regulator
MRPAKRIAGKTARPWHKTRESSGSVAAVALRAHAQQLVDPAAAALEVDAGNLRRASDLYGALRGDIIKGRLSPGMILNQVHLARIYHVSRTPIREALRMLQAEGMVEAEPQKRMRVTAIATDQVDSLYAIRILLEALGVALTLPRYTAEDRKDLARQVTALNSVASPNEEWWSGIHREFHMSLVKHSGPMLLDAIRIFSERADRVRRHFSSKLAADTMVFAREHAALARCFMKGKLDQAVRGIAVHLARNAMKAIGRIDQQYPAQGIRIAVALCSHPSTLATLNLEAIMAFDPVSPIRRR